MNNKRFYRVVSALPEPEPAGERVAAVLVLLWEGQRGPELVLERRSLSLKRQPGEVCLPGGGVEPGETPRACVLRETEEELGLREVRILAHLESLRHRTGERVEVFVGAVDSLRELRPQRSEVEEVFTIPLRWLCDHPPGVARYVLRPDYGASSPALHPFLSHYGRESDSPLWEWEGKVLWGMSARIIQGFVDRFAAELEPEDPERSEAASQRTQAGAV